MRILSAVLCWICFASITLAEDPVTEPVSGKIFQIEVIEDKFTAEVSAAEARVAKAEAELAKARQNAGAVRLKSYKSRLVDLTKTGNPAQAAAVKARIEWLEESPEVPSVIPLDQLPPGAAVYQYFPETERPYLVKAYVHHLSRESVIIDALTKKVASAKGATAIEEAQQTLDQSVAKYEQVKTTNEPPYIGQDINNWGQSKRGEAKGPVKPVEWTPGMLGWGQSECFVKKIQTKDEMVLTRAYGKTVQTLVVQGFDTSHMKVGEVAHLYSLLWVTGTTFHLGPNGKQIEVILVEKLDWDRYKEEQEKLMKK